MHRTKMGQTALHVSLLPSFLRSCTVLFDVKTVMAIQYLRWKQRLIPLRTAAEADLLNQNGYVSSLPDATGFTRHLRNARESTSK